MKKILCFGNPFIKEDNLALQLAEILDIEGFEFIKSENPQELMQHPDIFAIMDVTYGIKEVRIIDDIERINPNKMSSLHDFDLSFFIKLMHRLNKLDKLRMIAIPANMSKDEAEMQINSILKTL